MATMGIAKMGVAMTAATAGVVKVAAAVGTATGESAAGTATSASAAGAAVVVTMGGCNDGLDISRIDNGGENATCSRSGNGIFDANRCCGGSRS